MSIITTKEAAERLAGRFGKPQDAAAIESLRRLVLLWIKTGHLPATRSGGVWLVDSDVVDRFERPKMGRPKKPKPKPRSKKRGKA